MNWLKPKIVLSEEEQLIKEIIAAMLENPKTLIEVNPDDMSYMLSDEEKSYYIDLDSVGVKITNHNFMLDKRIELNKIDALKALIKAETIKRRVDKKNIIFQNGINLLNNIKNNLDGKANNS